MSKINGTQKSQQELKQKALQGYLVARDSVANLIELIERRSTMALFAIKDCERDLDGLERQIDAEIAAAITRVDEKTARELLACVKSITDLERIADLVLGVAERLHSLIRPLPANDKQQLRDMAATVEDMLNHVHEGLLQRDPAKTERVLRADVRINQICHSLFRQHLETGAGEHWRESASVLLMAQALERCGDHVKNLAEELFHLIEGRTLLHPPKKKTYG